MIQTTDLQLVLRQLIDEHRRLLRQMEQQQAAMRAMDYRAMEQANQQQESIRQRIAAIEMRRRSLVAAWAKAMRHPAEVRIEQIAQADPSGAELLKLRDELKEVLEQIRHRGQVAGKLAAGLLGHLNTVVSLLAGAVQTAGLYTRSGVPRISDRIGTIEAVG
jgi:phosphoserine phosphatase